MDKIYIPTTVRIRLQRIAIATHMATGEVIEKLLDFHSSDMTIIDNLRPTPLSTTDILTKYGMAPPKEK